jgi:hypothetical protein
MMVNWSDIDCRRPWHLTALYLWLNRISNTYPLLDSELWVGHVNTEVSLQFLSKRCTSFSPGVLGTALSHSRCLAFRSSVSIHLQLKFQGSIISVLRHARRGDFTAASRTPVTSAERRWGRSTCLWGMASVTAWSLPPFISGKRCVW